ncbi:hypothetical protein FHS96_004979 [Sphingomonas zeicaulis]|uniref:portal protein n=1 Tax=Sphingomonas zeicaulis TaxID=1632740 RepID=UPI003D263245
MLHDVDAILHRQGVMELSRTNFETMWNDIAEHVLPRQSEFLGNGWTEGLARMRRIYDERAILALDRGIATFEAYVIPRGQRWQTLEPRDDALLKTQRVREWYERKTSQLFALRSAPQSGFDTQAHESIASLLAFGTQGMWPELRRDRQGRPMGIFYRSEHIGQLYIMEDAWGRVDTVHRKFELTARQSIQRWGAAAPEKAKEMATDIRRSEDKITYLHVIEPNSRHEPGHIDWRGKPIASCYVELNSRELFSVGGYRTMPLIVSRFEKSPRETWGRSPAMTVLPAVKALQRMMRDLVTAIEFKARPPLLAGDDMLDYGIQLTPNGVTYGGLDDRGNQMVRAMFDGADLNDALQLQERTAALVDRAFWNDLYLVNQELKSHVTAVDIMERKAETGVLLAPLGRQETEWLNPQTDREIDLMWEMGLLDDMPPEVVEAGGLYQLGYDNPLARVQKAQSAGGFYRLLEGVTPIISARPEMLDQFLSIYPFEKLVRGLGYIHSVPASWEATDEEKAAAEQAQADAAAAERLLTAAPIVSKVANDLSQAEAVNAA